MNLKSVYDALNAQHEAVLVIMDRIDAHFEAGETDEALALSAELEEAKEKEAKIENLYHSMNESAQKNVVALFAPEAQKAEQAEKPEAIPLDEYNALAPKERLAFINSGGTLKE